MATGATEFLDNTSQDYFIPEVWSKETLRARENKLVFAKLVDRRFEKDAKVGDTIHVNDVPALAARTKSENTALEYETVSHTQADISITSHTYAAVAVEDITKVQTNMDQLSMFAGKMGYALALDVDDALAGLPDDFDNYVGTLAVELSDDDVLRARQYLNDADAPMENRAIVISPAQETGLLKLDRFVHNDYSRLHGNDGGSSLADAYVSSFYRMPIYVSVNVEGTNAAGHDNTMFQKEAIALVMQQDVKSYSQFDIDYLADKVVQTQIYGYKEMRDDHGVWMKGA